MSDHPGLVGPGAPTLEQATRLGFHSSLGQYSRRREQVTRRLVDDVIQQIDRRGIFRTPCLESMAILGMAADLIAHSRP